MLLSIISLNFRKPNLTIASMQSLYEMYKKEFDTHQFEYIVVDNHSEDTSTKVLSQMVKKYHGFQFVENTENNGFGAGNNLGARKALGKYLLFLNNDTQIKGRDLTDMVSFMEKHTDVGILGGGLKNFDGSEQVSVGQFLTFFPTLLLLLGLERFGLKKNPKTIRQVDWVKGALLMIRKTLFDKLHGFDENMFMYTEDMELCYRALQKGYKSYFYPISSVFHKDQGSSNRTFAIVNIYTNLLYFSKKHRPKWEYNMVKLLLQTKAIFLILYGKAFNKPYFVETYEKALAVVR